MDQIIEKLVSVKPSERQLSWQEMEFTAFFHYGINSFTDREWGNGQESISQFYPKDLNTDQWCESIKAAGIKGCIITAKHHDGFCLWNTAYTNHSVMYTPLKRDIVAELAASCQRYRIKLGVYLSPWDRHEATYGQGKIYDDYFCNQLTELMTNYGELYTVWFDGACGEGSNGKKQEYDWNRYYQLIRKLQPNAVISVSGPDVRWCGNEAGDCRPSEWSVVPAAAFSQSEIAKVSQQSDDTEFRSRKIDVMDLDLGSRDALRDIEELIWYPAEVDTSIRPGWFYHKSEDDKVKSLEELQRIYINSVGGNTVLLLNIPPHKDGYITHYDRERLQELGKFIRESFSNNLIGQASLKASSTEQPFDVTNLNDNSESYWKAEDYCDYCNISVELKDNHLIRYIVLSEQITCSQRVEMFTIDAEIDGAMCTVYNGTTIGYKKICPIHPVITKRIVINFIQFRKSPVLKSLCLC
ncbi:MAG TPA: alpha-L-fucosidase [Mobilitalea sp.]|nr:alpha-L-fucosidase [Mobilitalea sp.]